MSSLLRPNKLTTVSINGSCNDKFQRSNQVHLLQPKLTRQSGGLLKTSMFAGACSAHKPEPYSPACENLQQKCLEGSPWRVAVVTRGRLQSAELVGEKVRVL